MEAPLFSTFTLFTELIVTAAIFYVFYRSYKYNSFPVKIAVFALGYEIAFNISYMTYRFFDHGLAEPTTTEHGPFYIALAIFHGSFSLIMFIALIVFLLVAMKRYKQGINYFKKRKVLTGTFLGAWSMAVLSGVAFYFVAYF